LVGGDELSEYNLRGTLIGVEQINKPSIKPSIKLIDYDYYTMTKIERALNTIFAAVVISIVVFLFYRSILISLIMCPLGLLYPRIKVKNIIIKRKADLNLQFKDLLYSLSSSMSAGKSIERAFIDAVKDLQTLYPSTNTNINEEVQYIVRKLEMNETVEAALSDLARRAHVEDIDSFCDVFQTCKRAGGNLVDIIQNTSKIISYKIEIKEEINTMLAAKRFEQKVLNAMPIFMLLLLSVSATDYVSPIFTTSLGRLSMSVGIILLIAAYFISKKIMDIKI
jgi:tight adherence protein B